MATFNNTPTTTDSFGDDKYYILQNGRAKVQERSTISLGVLSDLLEDENLPWKLVPIGSPFPLIGDLPPANDPRYRYVVLTDADPYNDDVLINKEVSGTAPNLVIKYTIDMPDSPLNGTKIEMLNTMEAVLSPAVNNGKVFNDAIRNMTGSFFATFGNNDDLQVPMHGQGGVFRSSDSKTTRQITSTGNTLTVPTGVVFDASRQVPTGARNQTFAVGATYLMRIK